MIKVVKFGGSSLASAEQFAKVGKIIHADKERRYVVPSAPGKRNSKDTKVTDMLYACYDLVEKDEDFRVMLMKIKDRYDTIINGLNLKLSLEEEFFPESYYKVQKIQEWLNASYAADISGERLEEEFDGNFDYMNRIFKRVTGQTIFQYLTAVRMEHAKRLIAQTTMHTGVIGQEVGYPDEYYFSKVFKRNVGMSPRAYADSLSKNKS